MISALFAAAILLAETTPAAAPAAAPAAPAAPQATVDGAPVVKVKRDDMLCKQEEVLGTRIPKKVCYTRAEQEARSQQDRQNVERMQSQFGKISN